MFLRCCTFIALGAPLYASYTLVTPGSSIGFSACVYDQGGLPIPNQTVTWSVPAQAYSGFHSHNSPGRNPGTLFPQAGGQTDYTGCAYGTFQATDVAGIHVIEAYAHTSSGTVMDVLYCYVMVHDPYLQVLPNYYVYQKVGVQPEHTEPFNGTFNTVYRIQQICEQFYEDSGLVAGVNDMSLLWGGRFDLGPGYGGQWWGPPHNEHMWGLNVDFPYQYLGSTTQRARFREIAEQYRAIVVPEDNHFHLRFPD
jgi:hypothetical protein